MEEDIRWEQRFSNYQKAFGKLKEAVEFIRNTAHDVEDDDTWELMDEMRKESLIQRFEYTHELGWNVMKDYAHFQGNPSVAGSRDATREAFKLQLINDGEVWMDMIKSRNLTTHTYNEDTANEIFMKIMNHYYAAFFEFRNTMEEKRSGEQQSLF
ncbi:MAG TPA: nucleotidyltransferase substrate binding protein [Fluviicola sp.]|nr:nucleotidyltransferase substrate binding protein [Fluviicola sp.]